MHRGIRFLLVVLALPALALAQRPEPEQLWRNEITFPNDVHDHHKARVRPQPRVLPGFADVRIPFRFRAGESRAFYRADDRAVRRRHAARRRPAGGFGGGDPASVGRSAHPGIRHPTRASGPLHARRGGFAVPPRACPSARRRSGPRATPAIPGDGLSARSSSSRGPTSRRPIPPENCCPRTFC